MYTDYIDDDDYFPSSFYEEDDIDYELSFYHRLVTFLAIGMCWCGSYGEFGKVHVRMIDGHMEECGEYL